MPLSNPRTAKTPKASLPAGFHFTTLSHNHVSGNPSPTKFDSTIAAKLTQAAESVRMTLRDHIILADEQYYSFKDNKKL